jgi:hypothetical protein
MKKLDLVIVLAALAGGALWIEQGHRVVIDAPTAAELQLAAATAACPENDTMPYDSRCLEYLNVPARPAARLVVVSSRPRDVQPAPCPDNDKVPYSASCIAFLKGATETGMNWRVTEQPALAPTRN